MMFAPGGGFAKGAARLGLINPNGRYHMGIGQHRNMMQNQGSITQNKGNAMQNQTTSMGNQGNSAWGHTNPNEVILDKFGNPMRLDF
ncbi:hypothetical protein T36_0875 [Helicobacter cinaedi]|uniref:hypothetical protein n=1 Tax=Helicobacter cinaedi TaxID=213 RepID=UPI001F2CA867|nr:hypothetical protein [Helicobacter cinaedi]BDB64423.1 hypothetical protein T36_0875 [Helicobacter cinaedi]